MRTLGSLGILLALCVPAWAQSNPPDPQQLIDGALHHSDLFHAAHTQFVYEANFTAQLNVLTQGKILIRWGSKDQWRMEIEVGAFSMIKTRNGEQTLTLRKVPFTPLRVKELLSLLRFDSPDLNSFAHNLKKRRQNGGPIECAEYTISGSLHACADPSTDDLVSIETEWLDGKQRAEYSDFFDFDGLRVPRRLRLLTSVGYVLTMEVAHVDAQPFDDKLLQLPKEAIVRRECDGEKAPVSIKMSQIDWPKGTPPGNVITTVTVLQDGSVADVEVIGGSTKALNDAVAKALQTWRFRPATCGNDPVTSDIDVSFNAQRY